MRKTVKEETGIELCDQYGFAEVMGVGGECTEREGLHIWADHYLIEVIDPESLKVLGPGEEGELVVTTLTREAVPLIRYRTGDITMILDEGACRCGRTHPRIAPIRGRVHDMIKLQGEALLPRDIEDVILTIPELCQEYRIVLDQPAEVDVLKVVVEHVPQVSDLDSLKRKAELALEGRAGVQCQVELVPQGRLQQARFKAERINRTYKVQQA
jgi:phenylacetate-CoA ligase